MAGATHKLGFIGLGIMGRPMALNLRRAGHELRVYGRRAETMEPLTAAGAIACASAAEVAEKSDVIFTMVADTPDVEQVMTGDQGVFTGAKKGAIVVDMSSIAPQASRRLAELAARQGVEMLDAPVSGGEIGAIEGRLSIMVGGKKEVLDVVRPYLDVMGKSIVHVGAAGAGQVAKAANQIIVGVTIEAVAEALGLAKRAGVDPARVREALMGGFAASRVLEVHGGRMLSGKFEPGFKVRLHQKDLRIALETARALGLSLPATGTVAEQFAALAEAGGAELDHSALFRLFSGHDQ